MTEPIEELSADVAWARRVESLVERYDAGDVVAPRGMPTAERLHSTHAVDLKRPAVVNEGRAASPDFAAAEARWIVTGDDRVAPLVEHAPSIARFADVDPALHDDGTTTDLLGTRFYGAYGPRFVEQLPRVVRCLGEDPDTRQAWLTLWRPNPPPTRDVPCTIGLGWTVRNGRLDGHAYMRSSDVWLGLPYDVFTFSVLTYRVGQELAQLYHAFYDLGTLYVTAASSHLYERDVGKARAALDAESVRCRAISAWTGAAFDEALEAINHRLGYVADTPEWSFWEPDDD